MYRMHRMVLGLVLSLLAATPALADLDNRDAIAGVETMKAVYDVRKSDPRMMLAYLRAIESNHENLLKEGVEPDLRLVFIAEAVKFLTTEPEPEIDVKHAETLEAIAEQVEVLDELGIRMEVCGGATRAYGVDNDTVLDELEVVRSGFIAVMGYQNQGYALVPVY